MKSITLYPILFFFMSSVHAQIPLIVEGVNEMARFQTDLSKQTGGFISIKSTPSDYVGYIGIHPRRSTDIEMGTTLGSTGKINITIEEDPKVSIDQSGNVTIKNLRGFPNSIPRPVSVDFAGDLSAFTGRRSCVIPCNSFVANDADGEFTEIVNPVGTTQFIKHLSSSGELSAPISLPLGVIIIQFQFYFVNLSSVSDFEFAVYRTPFIPTSNEALERVSGRMTFPQAGSFSSATANQMEMAEGIVNHAPIEIEEDYLYSLVVKCEDCSNQYLRSVHLLYKYP